MTGERRQWAWAWIALVLPFLAYWTTGLFDVDEGFYAAVMAEMKRRGDWWIPTLGGAPWFEKPILLYWLSGLCTALFGDTFGPRLGSVLCSLGVGAMCAWYLRRMAGLAAAQTVLWLFAGTVLFALVGGMLLADMPLLCALTGAFVAHRASLNGRAGWAVLAGASLGAAVLAKGPMAIFIFGAVTAWTYIAEPDDRERLGRNWWGFFLAMTAVISIWYVPAYVRRPDAFVHDFLLKQNVYRLVGGDDAHRVPGWLYVPFFILVIAIAAAPWWAYAWSAYRSRRTFEPTIASDIRWLGRWFLVVLLLFTASGSKLPHYILPSIPPLLMLAALRIQGGAMGLRITMTAIVTALAWAAPQWYYRSSGQADAHAIARYVREQGGTLATFRLRARTRSVEPQATLQDTTLPSLHFVMDRWVPDLETDESLAATPHPFLLTRKGRLTPAEAASLGWQPVRLRLLTDKFELFQRVR